MPSILNLKFKGNKSFVAFSNLNDTEALTKTWKVCTKVASYLEQGQRLENLSWRLWHLQNLMVDTDNAKSKREFKKLSKFMGDKLDKEKGRSIEELKAPNYKNCHSADLIRQRAAEKERNREASQNAAPGTIKRMQFTFSVDPPSPAVAQTIKKPDFKPSAEFNRCSGHSVRAPRTEDDMVVDDGNDKDPPPPLTPQRSQRQDCETPTALRFPPLFSSGFGPTALLNSTPTLKTRMSYGEGFYPAPAPLHEGFSIMRPTIELPLDEILNTVDTSDNILDFWTLQYPEPPPSNNHDLSKFYHDQPQLQDIQMHLPTTISMNSYAAPPPPITRAATITPTSISPPTLPTAVPSAATTTSSNKTITSHKRKAASISVAPLRIPDSSDESSVNNDSDSEDSDFAVTRRTAAGASATTLAARRKRSSTIATGTGAGTSVSAGSRKGRRRSSTSAAKGSIPPLSQVVREVLPETVQPSKVNLLYDTRSSSNTPVAGTRPTLTVKTSGSPATRSSGHGATAMSLTSAAGLRSLNGNSSGPGGVKAECSNCGATHTPLWRRGLNDELNCNACGLYCKLHKRPRPKSMRNTHGSERTQVPNPRQQEAADVLGSSSPVPKPPPRSSSPVNRIAQCYNCHTTATPLWRKDDEGKTVCNACGLYYKLHGSARPISMKSDVIRKRSRHDARRGAASETSSASPDVSRRASPAPREEASPTLAPDSSTQMAFTDYSEDLDYRTTQSELLGALGDLTQTHPGLYFNLHNTNHFPGPYHPDYLTHLYTIPQGSDPLPFASPESSQDGGSNSGGSGSSGSGGNEAELTVSPRSNKRRRMSEDSASEPPSSTTSSYSSYTTDGGYATASTSATSVSMEFPFSSYGHHHAPGPSGSGSASSCPPGNGGGGGGGGGGAQGVGVGTYVLGPALRGSGNTFWHPPMMPQVEGSPQLFHPPMLPPSEDSPMDYLQPPSSASNGSGNKKGIGNGNGGSGGGGGGGAGAGMHHHQDETELLFSSFLHPPMTIPDDFGGGGGYGPAVHPPMLAEYHDMYESSMRVY